MLLDRFYDVILKLKSIFYCDMWESISGSFLGFFFFLVGIPEAALYGLLVAMIFDIITKIGAISKKNGGYINATKQKIIRSRVALNGFFSKFVSYFIILALAHMTQYFVPMLAAQAFKSIVYGILFYIEGHSCLENIIEAAPEGSSVAKATRLIMFQWGDLLERFFGNRRRDKGCDQ